MEAGILLRSTTEQIDETPIGELTSTFLAGMAQFDNQVRAERTLDGMKAAAKRGRWVWIAPLGYRNTRVGDKNIEPDPDTAPMVRKVFKMAADCRSLPEIRRHLDSRGFKRARGGRLTTGTLRRMLRNEIYCGRLVVPKWGLDGAGSWQPIVDRQTWLKAQRMLDSNGATAVPKQQARPDFPLRRFVRCTCGKPLTASYSRGRHGKRYPYYHCTVRGHVRVSRSKLEQAFLDQLRKLRPQPELVAIWRDLVTSIWNVRKDEIVRDVTVLEQRVAEVERRRKALVRAYVFKDAIEESDYNELRAQRRVSSRRNGSERVPYRRS